MEQKDLFDTQAELFSSGEHQANEQVGKINETIVIILDRE